MTFHRNSSFVCFKGKKHGSAAESSERAAWAALPAEVSYAALKCSKSTSRCSASCFKRACVFSPLLDHFK